MTELDDQVDALAGVPRKRLVGPWLLALVLAIATLVWLCNDVRESLAPARVSTTERPRGP